MEWQIIVALVVMIPVILLPVAFVWFLNLGGFAAITKRARERRAESVRRRAGAEVRSD
jgi:hypothetical protein